MWNRLHFRVRSPLNRCHSKRPADDARRERKLCPSLKRCTVVKTGGFGELPPGRKRPLAFIREVWGNDRFRGGTQTNIEKATTIAAIDDLPQ